MLTSSATTPSGHAGAAIGQVVSARGSQAQVGLPAPRGDVRASVGSFLAIDANGATLIGMVTEVLSRSIAGDAAAAYRALARVDLVGEIRPEQSATLAFRRGVHRHLAIDDPVRLVTKDELDAIYATSKSLSISIGRINQNSSVPANVDVENLLTKHFAVLGSTGVGKSSGVAVILRELLRANAPARILLLDVHNEYVNCFGDAANIIDPATFKLPFWLFNFDELCDVIYGGRPSVPDEADILAELIPIAKSAYLNYKTSSERAGVKRRDPRQTGFTIDTPVPYLLQDLISLIDERMGKLENRSSRMLHHRLLSRIESLKNDPRYSFVFESANVGGDIMASLLNQLFRLTDDGKAISILKLGSIPNEVVDAVVCVVLRLAFEFGLWSDGAKPLLCVCEEAHRFASADHHIGFAPTRRALARIAKEGRKYGVYLGLVSQRPAELDPTIISQCSTIFAMRMSNRQDQDLLRSAISDAAAGLLEEIPALGTSEVIGFGEGMPLPARFAFEPLSRRELPKSEMLTPSVDNAEGEIEPDLVKSAIERWRRATTNTLQKLEDSGDSAVKLLRERVGAMTQNAAPSAPATPAAPSAGSIVERMRDQILKR